MEREKNLRSYIIHGHFYQPPREDPITGKIPLESGAFPYPNFNEKIYYECYRPNSESGNFGKISFNIGPTLFNWLDNHHPETVQQIIAQDSENVKKYGVGNAMAQAYNHTILPLMSRRDKVTQVMWGIADFRHRFKRQPQGLWLPETAVDSETLEVLIESGIEYTILAPWQIHSDHSVPTQPCQVQSSNGKGITVFFYQRELSTMISFDPWSTINADVFAEYRMMPFFHQESETGQESQLLVIASDGELYGHHQPLRNFFLERLMDGAMSGLNITATFPGLWLENHPVLQSAKLIENTSWSCHHGLGRWLGDCECTPGNRAWKGHLRRAFLNLAEAVDGLYLEVTKPFIQNPWKLRDQYIYVLLGEMTLDQLLRQSEDLSLKTDEVRRIHQVLEAQRERQRMFTSCGWFFDDFDRIEPQNNVAYAAQAVHLMYEATGVDLAPQVVEDLRCIVGDKSRRTADSLFSQHLERARFHDNQIQVGFAD